jgi:hypothetical protein
MNIYVVAAIVLSIVQAVLAGGGIYAMVRSMRRFKAIASEREEIAVWKAWLGQLKWLAAAMVQLLMCSFLQLNWSSSWRVVLMVCATIFVLGLVLSLMMIRRIRAAAQDAGKVLRSGQDGMVLVRHLQPDRVRGMSDGGTLLHMSAEDLKDFKAIRGFAQMINLRVAMRYQDCAAGMVPILRFVNDNGASLVLYEDDDVVAA